MLIDISCMQEGRHVYSFLRIRGTFYALAQTGRSASRPHGRPAGVRVPWPVLYLAPSPVNDTTIYTPNVNLSLHDTQVQRLDAVRPRLYLTYG